jgi:hypothetical protein
MDFRHYGFAPDASRQADIASSSRAVDMPRKSLMLTKVRGSFPSPDCGGRMPIGSFVITEEQIDCLASWLQQFQQ